MKNVLRKLLVMQYLILLSNVPAIGQTNPWLPPFDIVDADEPTSEVSPPHAPTCDNSSPVYNSYYNRFDFYLDNYEKRPVTTIMLNFNIWQKDDGTGNWQNTPAEIARIHAVIDHVNAIYDSNCEPSDPIAGVTDLPDTKIRFEINEIYFYQNSTLWGEGSSGTSTNLNNAVAAIDINRMDQFNIHVTGGDYYGAGGFSWPAPSYNLNTEQGIVTFNNEALQSGDWVWGGHLAHELGHALDLSHTYNSAICNELVYDYLDDVFGSGSTAICPHDGGFGCEYTSPDNTCTNNMMGGTKDACYFSPKQIAKMHRALSLQSIRKYVKCEEYVAEPIVISTDELWDFDIKFYNPIQINPNTTLELKCKVTMAKNDKISVLPNASLRVNGGTITSDCETWSGIEVLGDVNDIAQSYSIQGHAYFYNDAVVENAQVAVRNFGTNAEGKKLWNTAGGIIQANNATFYNNRKSAEFIRYQRKNTNGALMNDRSYFRATDFSWDDGLRDTPLNHITMYKTYGVRITACNFTDDRINAPSEWITNQNPSSCGIRSIDSKFYVQAKCNSINLSNCVGDLTSNPTGWTPTTFKNLDFGIYASNASTENSILVDRSVFENNLYGIELVSSNSPTITRNHFNYTATKEYITGYKHGIHAIRTLEFRIEQNKFENNNSGNAAVGIVCSDIGENNVDVYKNTFINLNYANIAQGKNRNYETPGIANGTKGLQYLCNSNINNRYDHYVKSTLWGQNASVINGVKSINGAFDPLTLESLGSGIEFTQNGLTDEDYLNNSYHSIGYWYEDPITYPLREPIETTGLFDAEAANVLTCADNFVDKPIIKLLPLTKAQLIADFNTATVNLATKSNAYSTLENGGDKATLMAQIDNLAPNNKHQLRQTLLSYSPYLTGMLFVQ